MGRGYERIDDGMGILREKGRDMTQSYDKGPVPTENLIQPIDTTKSSTKGSIAQRLLTNLGRSVGETSTTKLVWLNSNLRT